MRGREEFDRQRLCRSLAIILLLFYWAVSLDQLAVFPTMGEDEPWIAAAPYKLATEGVFGSDLFAGYYRIEQVHYQHPPTYQFLLAGVFRLAGVGVFQMRFLPVTLGLFVLALSYGVGRQIGSSAVGLLALAILLGLRFAGGAEVTGIPLLDIGRVGRYDVGVPVFGLAAFWLFNRAEQGRSWFWYAGSGAAAGVAGLTHIYGLFWLPALTLILLLRRGWDLFGQPAVFWIAAGAVVVWLPWLLYVVSGWSYFLGQQRLVYDRFDLFDIRFYIDNLLREVDRYRMADLFDDQGYPRLLRPGLWTMILALPVSLALILCRGRSQAVALAFALLLQAGLFALLLKQKHYNYVIALWPLAALVLAWAGVLGWRIHRWRPIIGVVLFLILIEGAVGIQRRSGLAAQTTPYDEFSARVAEYVPEGSLVLGLQHYWFGLREYEYRTWLLPFFWASEQTYHAPMSLDQALQRVDPDVVLIDRHMGGFFERAAAPPDPQQDTYKAYKRFMDRHGAMLAGIVDDPDYGRMEIYWLEQ